MKISYRHDTDMFIVSASVAAQRCFAHGSELRFSPLLNISTGLYYYYCFN